MSYMKGEQEKNNNEIIAILQDQLKSEIKEINPSQNNIEERIDNRQRIRGTYSLRKSEERVEEEV